MKKHLKALSFLSLICSIEMVTRALVPSIKSGDCPDSKIFGMAVIIVLSLLSHFLTVYKWTPVTILWGCLLIGTDRIAYVCPDAGRGIFLTVSFAVFEIGLLMLWQGLKEKLRFSPLQTVSFLALVLSPAWPLILDHLFGVQLLRWVCYSVPVAALVAVVDTFCTDEVHDSLPG